MNRVIRARLERAARHRIPAKPPRVFAPEAGLWYCEALPVELLEPHVPRVSRVQGALLDRLRESILLHGLANPFITVSELPAPNLDDWREWRYRFLYKCSAPVKVVVGHNRHECIRQLGWSTVPVLHCGDIPVVAERLPWELVDLAGAQRYFRDGRVGLGPYSLVMEQFTPPLKAVPAGF